MKRIFALLLTATILFSQNQYMAYAMTADCQQLFQVADSNGCTNFGCIARNGSTLYALKTNSANTKSVLYCYKNYESSKRTCTKYNVSSSVGHGNGMTYYNGSLYVAGGTNNLWKVSVTGKASKVTVSAGGSNYNYWNITHYTGNKFIVKVAKDGTYLKYGIGTLSGSTLTLSSYFYVKNSGYDTNQDITVTGNELLLIVTTDSTLKKNIILECCLGDNIGNYNGSPTYSITDKITVNGSSSYSKYEVEGVCNNADGEPIICMNLRKTSDCDAVARINNIVY